MAPSSWPLSNLPSCHFLANSRSSFSEWFNRSDRILHGHLVVVQYMLNAVDGAIELALVESAILPLLGKLPKLLFGMVQPVRSDPARASCCRPIHAERCRWRHRVGPCRICHPATSWQTPEAPFRNGSTGQIGSCTGILLSSNTC